MKLNPFVPEYEEFEVKTDLTPDEVQLLLQKNMIPPAIWCPDKFMGSTQDHKFTCKLNFAGSAFFPVLSGRIIPFDRGAVVKAHLQVDHFAQIFIYICLGVAWFTLLTSFCIVIFELIVGPRFALGWFVRGVGCWLFIGFCALIWPILWGKTKHIFIDLF